MLDDLFKALCTGKTKIFHNKNILTQLNLIKISGKMTKKLNFVYFICAGMYISCCHQRKGLITAYETVIDKCIKIKFNKKK